jgi:hypothetical protein
VSPSGLKKPNNSPGELFDSSEIQLASWGAVSAANGRNARKKSNWDSSDSQFFVSKDKISFLEPESGFLSQIPLSADAQNERNLDAQMKRYPGGDQQSRFQSPRGTFSQISQNVDA